MLYLNNKFYTLIGSRNTPQDICNKLTNLAISLGNDSWVGRSGGANGADQCLEDAYFDNIDNNNFKMEIYLPWNNFNNKKGNDVGYCDTSKLKTYKEAEEIASKVHPNWNACKYGVRKLHTRNVMQILGFKLDKPSEFVVCYAEPLQETQPFHNEFNPELQAYVKGGTGTAVKLAVDNKIPVYNFYYRDYTDGILNIYKNR